MKRLLFSCFLICAGLSVMGSSCSSTNTATPPNPVIQAIMAPIEAVGCSVETSIVSVAAGVMNSQCDAPVTSATTCINAAIGNANICALPGVANITSDMLKAMALAKKGHLKPMGVVGNLACPAGVQFFLGLFTTAIPSSCGCTKNLAASTFATGLTAACEAAVPI